MASASYPQSHFKHPTSGFVIVWLFIQGIIIPLLGQHAIGQTFDLVKKVDAFPIEDQNGAPYPFPLLGGLNAPRPQFVDIDGDGDLDLFLQENRHDLYFLENIGSGTAHQFKWKTDKYEDLDIDDWYRFVDLDGDSDFDLLTSRASSLISYFRNDGTVNAPTWILAADTLKDIGQMSIHAEIASIPFLTDIDDNGYPDLFIGRQSGRVSYYKNQGTDANNLPRFEFITDTFQGLLIIGGASKNTLHGANAPEYVDIDGDLDSDLFWGDFFWRSLYFLENTGTPASPHLEVTDSTYPPANPLINGGWNVPRFADIDADGDFDLFVGEIGGAFALTSSQIQNFYFLRNTGTQQSPLFNLETKRFISSLDLGQKSIPALVDINNDGDLDLFIAAEVDPTDPNYSSLNFFENIGTAESPTYKLIDPDYLNLNFGYSYSPAFVDIDADGDQDLFIGKFFGQIYFLENTGTAATPNFPTIVQNYSGIDVGSNATPTFVDIDDDNDFDLFIGEYTGNINFFENTGDSSSANFILADENYFGIDVSETSFPSFADVDGDGDFDLIIGSQSLGFKFYRNNGNPQIANFMEEPAFDIHPPLSSAPLLKDIDNDGDLDLFSGTLGGGLVFYENLDSTTAIQNHGKTNLPASPQLYQNYPNPFNPATIIRFKISNFGFVELGVYDLLGREVATLVNRALAPGSYEIKWDGTDNSVRKMTSGIYVYRLEVGSFRLSHKMLLMR